MTGQKKNNKRGKNGMISVNETIAVNKRARFDYEIGDVFEAGIMLLGTEVKSLRLGQASIAEAYVGPGRDSDSGNLFIFNANIPEYQQAGQHLQHDPKRIKRLLLHKRELGKLLGGVTREGFSIVPLRLFFNGRGLAKLEIALGKGKKLHDKRDTERDRDWNRDKQRIMRDRG
jgi:SsrA-binding protein